MRHQIIDNFLPVDQFKDLQDFMLGREIQWTFLDGVAVPGDGYHQFTKIFYNHFQPYPDFNRLGAIIHILNPVSIVRIKANMHLRTPEVIQHPFHTDVDDCNTAIYYVNSNNGKTIFENGLEVESIENRLLVFDSNEKHTGTTCTDSLRRCVINFNYHL